MQRAGWTVITFHYRGSWGSGGAFSLKAGVEDVDALLDQLEQPTTADAWGIDPKRIVVMGHSYGGYVAAHAAATRPSLIAAALIAPWDMSEDARAWAKLSEAERLKVMTGDNNDIDGRLGSITAADIVHQVMHDGPDLDLAKLAPALAAKSLLVVTAVHDDADDQAVSLLPALRANAAVHVTAKELATDHGFNDHRIALETIVLNWLARLPNAPKA
jgi:pimeloyl-ACP methyl ester carboxylesterase